jgi:hypothetical protein
MDSMLVGHTFACHSALVVGTRGDGRGTITFSINKHLYHVGWLMMVKIKGLIHLIVVMLRNEDSVFLIVA